jgi:hypothetical protein
MSGYRPIYKKIWKDPDFEELNPDDKLLFMYLFTNDATNESGIYPLTAKTAANETGIPLPTVAQRFNNGFYKNVVYDNEHRLIFVKNLRKYNTGGRSDLIYKAIHNEYVLYKDTFLWQDFFKYYPEFKGLDNGCQTVCQPTDTIRYDNNNDTIRYKEKDIELPGWIDEKTWGDFITHRRKLKRPATPRAKELLAIKLEKMKEQGDNPNEVLEQSIINGWQGVFPLKSKEGGVYGTHQKPFTKKGYTPEEYKRGSGVGDYGDRVV